MNALSRLWKWIAGGAVGLVGGAMLMSSDDSTEGSGGSTPPGPGGFPWVGPPVSGMPQGKGIFVRSVSQGGGPSLFADRMGYMGMDWALIQSMFHDRSGMRIRDTSEYPAYAAELARVDCTPWVWGWPRPESVREFVDSSMRAIEALDAPGLLINAESAYRGAGAADNARALIEACRDALDGRPLGITTYGGGPGFIKSYPWDVFASVDFVVPQFYNAKRTHRPSLQRESVARYVADGHRNIIPVWGASNKYDPEFMQLMADRTPIPSGAVCWWDLYWLLLSSERVEWVRNYQIPAPRGGAVA